MEDLAFHRELRTSVVPDALGYPLLGKTDNSYSGSGDAEMTV